MLDLFTIKDVLSINNRNANYILKYNSRKKYPIVDDKYKTKKLLEGSIPVPELFFTIEIERQIQGVEELLSEHKDFVVKPACGSGGDGILVISGKSKSMYRKINGQLMSVEDIKYHFSNTLSGLYSLGGQPDKAIVESRVKPDPVFESISYLGIPDIRIIVFMGVPVMAMVRLPTILSEGKANLHQGAIGAGIDILTGKTLSAVWGNEVIFEHPDTENTVTGVTVPYWDKLLEISSICYELTELGYIGVDMVLDKDKGPMLLELNARPGLNIQIANKTGLLKRLKKVEFCYKKLRSVSDRISFSKKNFGVNVQKN